MNISRIDLNLLVVLEAIYAEGSITRASERLHLSQPATSHALRRLRDTLDDPLFVRSGQAMRPTPLTQNIIGPVRRALHDIEASLTEAENFDPARSDRCFRIGIRAALEGALLPPLMRTLQAESPGLRVEAVRCDRNNLASDLDSGLLDMALDTLVPLGRDIRHQHTGGDQLVVVLAAKHPRIGSTLSLQDYLSEQHILVSSRRSGGGFEDVELSRLGHRRQIRLRCQHQFTACRVVASSDLLATMPHSAAVVSNAGLDNRLLPFPVATAALDAYLYWHSHADHDPANCWLRHRILRILA